MLIMLPFYEKLQKVIKKLQQVTRGYNKIASTESTRIMLALVATTSPTHPHPLPILKTLLHYHTTTTHYTTILLYYIPTNII